MARATIRQRPDGIPEIVRPRRLRAALVTLAGAAAALALLPAVFAAAAVYLALGIPLLLGLALFFTGRALRRRARRQPAPAIPLRVAAASPQARGAGLRRPS